MSRSNGQFPVDAVVTWVDGSDPVHAAKREEENSKPRKFQVTAVPGGKSRTRFADSGEIRYCVLAIRKHCPWIRTIFLVTDGQVPRFLEAGVAEKLGVRLVDHKQLFRGHEWALPTFNSQSIETGLHRIEGLADRFVYFNDDVIVLEQTAVDEFFSQDGRVVLRGEWKPLPKFGGWRVLVSSLANHVADKLLGKVRSMAVLAQYRSAQLAGFKRQFLQAPHTPHPVRTATIGNFFARNPGVFESNIKYRFRDMDQFAPIPLANHLEIRADTYVEAQSADYTLICFNRDSLRAIDEKIARLEEGGQRFLCVQGFEVADPVRRRRLLDVLNESVLGAD